MPSEEDEILTKFEKRGVMSTLPARELDFSGKYGVDGG